MITFWETVTRLGNVSTIVLFAFCAFCFFWYKKYQGLALRLAAALVVNEVIVFALKYLVREPRPLHPLTAPEDSFSFPSGHAAVAVAFYGGFVYLLSRTNLVSETSKKVLWGVAVLLVILIGLSRIQLVVHYPGDVLAGYIIGLISWVLVA